MSLFSLEYVILVAAAVGLYYLLPRRFRWVWLLLCSYAFYLCASPWMALFLVGTTLSVYACALWMSKQERAHQEALRQADDGLSREDKRARKAALTRRKRRVLALGLIVNLGALFALKYAPTYLNAAQGPLSRLLPGMRFPVGDWVLPLGISFYTLQTAGYLIDVYRGKVKAERNVFKFALFAGYFPQMLQGPINRYAELAPQLYEGQPFCWSHLKNGTLRVAVGLCKKLIIADRIALMIAPVLKDYQAYDGLTIFLCAAAYLLQLYADFSGGIDVVCGVSEMLGIRMAENFRRPLFSKTIPEFWRRWHITLGTWMRDYVFYPLSLSKAAGRIGHAAQKLLGKRVGGQLPTYLANLAVFLLVGMWHGANAKFIGFGLYFGVLIVLGQAFAPLAQRLTKALRVRTESFSHRLFQMLRTLLLCVAGMYFAMAQSLSEALRMLWRTVRMLRTSWDVALYWRDVDMSHMSQWFFLLLLIVWLALSAREEQGLDLREALAKQDLWLRWLVYLGLIFALLLLSADSANLLGGFIYAQY